MVKAVCKRLFEKNLNKDKNTADKLRRLEEFYIPMNFAVNILFNISSQFIGYSYLCKVKRYIHVR